MELRVYPRILRRNRQAYKRLGHAVRGIYPRTYTDLDIVSTGLQTSFEDPMCLSPTTTHTVLREGNRKASGVRSPGDLRIPAGLVWLP